MSDATRQKAEAALADVESVSRAVLPEPTDANAIVPLEKADATQSAEIARRSFVHRAGSLYGLHVVMAELCRFPSIEPASSTTHP